MKPLARVPGLVRSTVCASPGTPDFRQLLLDLLARPGRALAPAGPAPWPRLVTETALALGADPLAAAGAAAAVELAVAAIDVVDELIDDEWVGDAASRARGQNASLALAFLAQRAAAGLAERLGAERACLIADLLAGGSVACSDGQDLDLLLEPRTDVSEEQAFEMTGRKSGSLVAMACQVGAAAASADRRVIDAAGRLGFLIGVVEQLLNDLNDVSYEPERRKGDLRRRKKTLPVAFGLRCAHEEGVGQILAWYTGDSASAEEEQALVETLHDLGAQQYTWAVAHVQRREALDALRELARLSDRPEVLRLGRLVPAVRAKRRPRAA